MANLCAAEMATDAARAEPWVEGSTGQPKPHPGFGVANAYDTMALALYREITRSVDEMIPELANCLRVAPPPSTLRTVILKALLCMESSSCARLVPRSLVLTSGRRRVSGAVDDSRE